MFSAFKKLTKSSDDRCQAPLPMSSSLQKKFSRGVHFNMKLIIKGDRNVGKSCLLQRLQGGPFIEEYVPTDQIQVAPIHWTYKNTDYIVKVEVWEVVDKGRTKKKPPLGLKLENQSAPSAADNTNEVPVLDASFLDVYKNTSGVILMMDITKPWTFDYVVKELSSVPADLPVAVLGNHCDMQHHRQVHPHHIEQALHHAKLTRSAPVRYAESSMRNGFGLRLLHKFFSVPFLRLQKTSLLEQLQRNQKDTEEIEKELDYFQSSEESDYNTFVDRLVNKRRQTSGAGAAAGQPEPRPNNERSPSIVLGAGKPIIPPNVNPLLAQSLNSLGSTPRNKPNIPQASQSQYVSPDLLKPKHPVSMEMTPTRNQESRPSTPSTPTTANTSASGVSGALDEFYAGTLDSTFLDDLTPHSNTNQEVNYESDSDDGNLCNPMVTIDEDDLDIDITPTGTRSNLRSKLESNIRVTNKEERLQSMFESYASLTEQEKDYRGADNVQTRNKIHNTDLGLDSECPLWMGDASARQSPEGGEDPDVPKEAEEKAEKKHKKKKSKEKDRGDYSDKSERKERKHKHKKSKGEKHGPQDLLAPTEPIEFNYEEYDSI